MPDQWPRWQPTPFMRIVHDWHRPEESGFGNAYDALRQGEHGDLLEDMGDLHSIAVPSTYEGQDIWDQMVDEELDR